MVNGWERAEQDERWPTAPDGHLNMLWVLEAYHLIATTIETEIKRLNDDNSGDARVSDHSNAYVHGFANRTV